MRTDTPTPTRLATRRIGARVGAVDEYSALQMAAMDRLVHCGLEVTAATARLRAGMRKLAEDLGLDDHDIRDAVAPVVAATELALSDVQDEFHRLTIQVLRMGRYRLGLC
jgi:hypothetical protein